jgi:DNA polymerase-3 subunit alpha
LDLLIRYGNKAQADKAIISNSLFGGDNEIQVAKPELPIVERWPELIRLNKEKDLVGMYISSHPLDSFSVIMKYVCNTTMDDIKQGNLVSNKELIFGGIVSDVRERTSKKNEIFAFVTIEDYSGSVEIPFWAKDYMEFGKYLRTSMFLMLKGSWQNKAYKPEEMELKIHSVGLLSEVAETGIEKINISLPLSAIDKSFVDNLYDEVNKYPGKSTLSFTIMDYDEEMPLRIDLFSKAFHVNPDKSLIRFLEQIDFAELKIN